MKSDLIKYKGRFIAIITLLLMTLGGIMTDVSAQSTRSRRVVSSNGKSTQQDTRSRRKITVERPNMDVIKNETLDPDSKFYFPKLMEKYLYNDTIMTNEEYRYLYLGYMFQEDYDPYRKSYYAEMTDDLRRKKVHTKEERDTIRKYAELALQDNPFDLRQMSFLIHVLKEMKKPMSAKIWEYRLEHLLGAIKSTGTGESTESAWYVIYPMHEYDMINFLGYEATDVDFIDPAYDYLTVVPDSDNKRTGKTAKGFYFNVEIPQKEFINKHPEDVEEE